MVIQVQIGKHGRSTIVDDADFERIKEMKWHEIRKPIGDRNAYYAANETRIGGLRVKTYLHRFLMSPGPGMVVDHINGDTLDNRRENLRVCTHAENIRNAVKRKITDSSPYKGVYRYGIKGKWLSHIQVDGKVINLGVFTCPIEAAKAYDKAATKYHGAFARINFPENRTIPEQEFKELTVDREEFSA